MKRILLILVLSCFGLVLAEVDAHAQFKEEAFTQSYNDQKDSLATADTTSKLVDFKEIFGGLAHKRTMRIGSMFGSSVLLPGTAQIYNKDYWKLPIFYGGIGAGLAAGFIYQNKFEKTGTNKFNTFSTLGFAAAGVVYYASLMDGVVSYKSDRNPLPGRATIYSILCPGLGQAYNGEYWKIPIYVGGLAASGYYYYFFKTNYIRFRNIYREACEEGYSGPVTADQAKYYRDSYRRYRDYGLLAIGLVYLLQVIDANVFCYMNDFDVTENVALHVEPTVIMPQNYASNFSSAGIPATGISFGLRF